MTIYRLNLREDDLDELRRQLGNRRALAFSRGYEQIADESTYLLGVLDTATPVGTTNEEGKLSMKRDRQYYGLRPHLGYLGCIEFVVAAALLIGLVVLLIGVVVL